jgi:hypothetical protein
MHDANNILHLDEDMTDLSMNHYKAGVNIYLLGYLVVRCIPRRLWIT